LHTHLQKDPGSATGGSRSEVGLVGKVTWA
jgi:hypothetical protein